MQRDASFAKRLRHACAHGSKADQADQADQARLASMCSIHFFTQHPCGHHLNSSDAGQWACPARPPERCARSPELDARLERFEAGKHGRADGQAKRNSQICHTTLTAACASRVGPLAARFTPSIKSRVARTQSRAAFRTSHGTQLNYSLNTRADGHIWPKLQALRCQPGHEIRMLGFAGGPRDSSIQICHTLTVHGLKAGGLAGVEAWGFGSGADVTGPDCKSSPFQRKK